MIRRTLTQVIAEKSSRLCPACLRRAMLTSTGQCANCNQTAHLVKTLSRAEVLKGYDPFEWVPPVLKAEFV